MIDKAMRKLRAIEAAFVALLLVFAAGVIVGYFNTANAAPSGTLSVTPLTGVVPASVTATWTTTELTACTKTGTGWSGTAGPSGTVTIPFTVSGTYTFSLACTGASGLPGGATVSWTRPTQNVDGTALAASDITGYRVFASTAADLSNNTRYDTNGTTTTLRIEPLPDGTWYFGVRTVKVGDLVSAMSAIVNKAIVASPAVSWASPVTSVVLQSPPKPPGNVTATTTLVMLKRNASGYWIAGAVGTVELGVPCEKPMLLERAGAIPDYYAVDPNSPGVTITKNVPASATVAAQCFAG